MEILTDEPCEVNDTYEPTPEEWAWLREQATGGHDAELSPDEAAMLAGTVSALAWWSEHLDPDPEPDQYPENPWF